MLKTVLIKELTENLFGSRFLLVLLISVSLFSLSFYLMAADYQRRLLDYSELEQSKDPTVVELKPEPQALSIFARGLSATLERTIRITRLMGTAIEKVSALPDEAQRNLIFGVAPDPSFIIKIIFPLIVIIFAYDSISGEKERGTLKLMMSNPISRPATILAKWLGLFIPLALCLLLGLFPGLIQILTSDSIRLSSDQWLKITGIVLVSLLYVSAFVSLSLLVSARTRSPATSIIALLFSWVGLVLFIPSISPLVSQQVAPAPSAMEIFEEKLALKRQADMRAKNFSLIQSFEDWATTMRRIKESRMAVEREVLEHSEKLDREFVLKSLAQRRLALNLARLSPTGSYVNLVTTLAGTGSSGEERYLAQIMNYATLIRRFDAPSQDELAPLNKLPRFEFHRNDLGEMARDLRTDLAMLLLYSSTLFVLAYISFLNYDVR